MQDQASKLAQSVSVFKLETPQTVTLAKTPRAAFSAVGKKVLPAASAISAPRSKRLELQLASKEWEQF
jgi:hypothetical protein